MLVYIRPSFCYKCCDLAIPSKSYRAQGNCAIRSSIFNHIPHDGNTHPCHACRRYQRRTRVERHVARAALHDRILESHLRLAQGQSQTLIT